MIISFLEYLMSILIVLDCRSVYRYSIKDYKIPELATLVSMLLVIFIIIKRKDNIKNAAKLIRYLLFYYMFIIFFILLHDKTNIYSYISSFGIILPMMYTYYYLKEDTNKAIIEFLSKISNVIIVISFFSTILYILGPVLNIIGRTGTIYMNWGGIRKIPSYFGLEFVTQKENFFGNSVIRNTSIFTEGPMYCLNLTIALAIQIFIVPKKSKAKHFILIISILTTYTTTGLIIMIMMELASKLVLKEKTELMRLIKITIIPIICIVGLLCVKILFLQKAKTTSYSTRIDDYRACFLAWKNHIIIGNGYGKGYIIKEYMSRFRRHNLGLSNSILELLAQGGIYLFSLYAIPMYKGIKFGIKNNKIQITIFTITITILYITTIFTYTIMILNLLSMAYALKDKEKKELIDDEI